MNIQDITGVELDACTGHTPDFFEELASDELKEKCKTKFVCSNLLSPFHQNKINQHNRGELCMTACLYHWTDRHRKLYDLLRNVSKICKKLDLSWVLYYGSLLGFFRNKQLLKWDIDLDIVMPWTIRDKLHNIAQKNGGSVIYEDDQVRFYLKHDTPSIMAIFLDKRTLLYCDVFFWILENNNVKVSRDPVKGQEFLVIPKNKFLPLKLTLIDNIPIYIPNDIEYNLKTRYPTYKNEPYTLHNNSYLHK